MLSTSVLCVNDQQVLKVCPPVIEEKNGTVALARQPETNVYTDGRYKVCDTVDSLEDGLYKIIRTIQNVCVEQLTFKSIIEVRTCFQPTRYLVPAILYNGNHFGQSNTPAGLTRDGEPWVFAYDRTAIPSCTLTENADYGAALFASDEDEISLVSACSIIKNDDDTMTQRVYHPVTEAPYTYSGKCRMSERYDTYLTLNPGESVTLKTYAFVCKPRWKNYAFAPLAEAVSRVMPFDKQPVHSAQRVWDLGITYVKALSYRYKGHAVLCTNHSPKTYVLQHSGVLTNEEMAQLLSDPENSRIVRNEGRFEMGWADQNLLNARMLAEDAIARSDEQQLALAIEIVENWANTQRPNGLAHTQFQQNFDENEANIPVDTCNLGWGICEMTQMYRFLHQNAIEKPQLLQFAIRLADFFVAHYSDAYGFGKTWSMMGELQDPTGSSGGFVLMGLMELYRETKNEAYLACAQKAHRFYFDRDLDQFVATAGALDCECVDKETAFPFIRAALDLYKATGESGYLDDAQKAAYYFVSWCFTFDSVYPPESDFAKYHYYTSGGTAISAEHHAIDAWGSAVVDELSDLYTITGNECWLGWAKAMWCNAILCITEDPEDEIHGQKRPVGAQNEGFFQCRWTKYRPTCEERGHFNDCLASWCGAYRMMAISRLREKDRLEYLR